MTVTITKKESGYLLESEFVVPFSAEDVFGFFADARNLEAITPPTLNFHILTPEPIEMRAGRLIRYRLSLHGMPIQWQSEISAWEPPFRFVDEQRQGPYRRWVHEHRFEPCEEGTRIIDRVRYEVAGPDFIHDRFVGPELRKIFEYRAKRLETFFAPRGEGRKRLRIAVSGASGLVGSELTARLAAQGHEVHRLVRNVRDGGTGGIAWCPRSGWIEDDKLEDLDAVIHLAGENIAEGRWTAVKKRRIHESRVLGTELLARTLAGLDRPPRSFICASAIGFYGDRGEEPLTEISALGEGFLPDVCRDWEAAAAPAREAGIRVAHLRLGVVLSLAGGALRKMLPPFKLGAGGRLGDGQQWMSWISLDDTVRAIEHALHHEELHGAVNLTAPRPVTNLEFTKALGRALRRPTFAPVPAPAIRLLLGQMADDLLLSSALVLPEALRVSGFEWRHPTLKDALEEMINGTAPERPARRLPEPDGKGQKAGVGVSAGQGAMSGTP